jgi:hypothetical protein
MNNATWKFFGTYAPGFPTYRIAQLAELISNSFFYDFINTPMEEWVNWFYNENFVMNDYWENHYHFGLETKKHKYCISNQTKELILINVVIPIMYWWGVLQQNEKWVENAYTLLENIQPESNSIIKNWKKLGVTLISAKDSQGLLELKNEFCNRKKCLSCKI